MDGTVGSQIFSVRPPRREGYLAGKADWSDFRRE